MPVSKKPQSAKKKTVRVRLKKKRLALFITLLVFIASIGLLVFALQTKEEPEKKPNFVIIYTDDLDEKLIDYLPKTKKYIAEKGASLENYIDNISLCCPARVSMLRGQYAHNTTIYGNTMPSGGFEKFYRSGQESSTVATWLKDSGYNTALMGKYLNEYPIDKDPTYVPPGWTDWAVPAKGKAYSQFNYWLNENGKLVKYGNEEKDYMVDVINDKAVNYIKNHTEDPYMLLLSTYSPHGPYPAAPRYENAYAEATYPKNPSFNEEDVSDKPTPIRNAEQFDAGKVAELDNNFRKRIRSMLAVDDMIENMYKTLETSGQLDNTYIIFTSDNGYHMGEHRMGVGKHTPYEEDIRMPFYITGPGIKPGSKVNEVTGNIDVAPTLADLAGVATPKFVDGLSFRSLLLGEQLKWRQYYLIQRGAVDENTHDARGINEPPDEMNPPDKPKRLQKFIGVRTEQYVYIEYPQSLQQEFYDLKKDPYQLNNLLRYGEENLNESQQTTVDNLKQALKRLQDCKTTTCR